MASVSETITEKQKAASDQQTAAWAKRLQTLEGVTESQIRAIAANPLFVEKRVVPFCQALGRLDTEAAMQIFNSAPYPHQVVFTLWLAGELEIAPVRQSFIEKHA